MIAIDTSSTRPFSFEDDKDSPPTIFHLGFLEPEVEAMIDDSATRYQVNNKGTDQQADAIVSMSQRAIDAVRHGLRGWDNFKDPNGDLVPLEFVSLGTKLGPRQVVSTRSLKRLPLSRIKILAKEIRKNGGLMEDDAKNSESPSA